MEETMNSYLSFAENDYQFFRHAYDSGNKGTALAALGQNICEWYLKHVISTYARPENAREAHEKENILRTHSLNKLMNYISEKMGIDIPEDTELRMDIIDGYYFTTRYPGSESFIPSDREINKANRAVDAARDFTLQICRELDQEQDFNENHDEYSDFGFDDEERE